jgi:DedD protein
MAEQQQDVDTLKRRGRRRLVGAVALVLLAVIVLPMVFDPEPRRTPPPVSVRIPGEDDSTFTPKLATKPAPAPAPKAEEKKDIPARAEDKAPAPAAAANKPETRKPQPKVEAKGTEQARAEAALAGSEYMVPVGAFANVEPVIAKLSAAKIPYYTQPVATASGTVTRVRAGPFASQAEAEKAAQALKGLGFKPGSVGAKSG